MFAVNHIAVGAIIAVQVENVPLAIAASFLSHLVLDVFPHYGLKHANPPVSHQQRGRILMRVGPIDAALSVVLMYLMYLQGMTIGMLAIAVVSLIPDFIWIYRFLFREKRGKLPPAMKDPFSRFHSWIQWGEYSWGWAIELVFAVGIYSYIFNNLLA